MRQSSNHLPTATLFGLTGDVPTPGDYDGDGATDFAVFRPATGIWYVIQSSNGGFRAAPLGQMNDLPIPANYQSR
ncbi:MAG: hypothetical protein LH472_10325 [Pyrinomonadaceae bacterium]|nr:hypothetical protein [Pyrinomonadaceae bacterium]